jgi:hypothetical protein
MSGPVTRALARLVHGSAQVDRAFRLFDRLRSKAVLRLASDGFYAAYNDVTYAGQDVYRPGAEAFRTALFPFERRVVQAHFPPPPSTLLIGGAGGGREAFALAALGYRIVAFEPSSSLAGAMAGPPPTGGTIEPAVGRYEDLPILRAAVAPYRSIDLTQRARFDAAIFGWTSFSHLRSDESCVEALRRMAGLTAGPILVSFLPRPRVTGGAAPPRDMFSVSLGYVHYMTGGELRAYASAADLEVVLLDEEDNWPHAVLSPTASVDAARPS